LQASLANQPDVALGNVVGSNIANILLILGVAALIASPLRVNNTIVWLDTPVMIGASALLLYLSLDGVLSQQDGVILLAILTLYTLLRLLRSRSGDIKRQATHRLAANSAATDTREGVRGARLLRDTLFIGLGLAMLILGARWIVDGAVAFAAALGMSQLLVSLTIVAGGTSLPELETTVIVFLCFLASTSGRKAAIFQRV
jgi:cation:H+ antiporter